MLSLTKNIEASGANYDENADEQLLKIFDEIEKKESNGTYLMNPKRVSEFVGSYRYLRTVFGSSHSVSYRQRDGIGKTGWDMFVRGKYLSFCDTSGIVDNVLSKADCFEVSAYKNGDIELALTFYDMMVRGK